VTAADLITDLTELVVGLACLGAAPFAWRRARWLGTALAIAGLAALVHTIASLV
jgi:hypothetical protein